MKSMDYILKHSFENDLPDSLGFVGTVMLQWQPVQCQQHMWVTGAGTTHALLIRALCPTALKPANSH